MKRPFTYILLTTILVSFVSCSTGSRELSEEEIAVSQQLKERYDRLDILVFNQDTLLASKEVLDYYRNHNYEPIWIQKNDLNPQGREMYDLIGNAKNYGLLPEMYHYSIIQSKRGKKDEFLDVEMLLTNAFFLMNTHISEGYIDTLNKAYVWRKDSLDFKLENELQKVIEGKSVKTVIENHEPTIAAYHDIKKGLQKFLDEYPLDTAHIKIHDFKDDSVKCYETAHSALILHGFIDSTVSTQDSTFIVQLKYFQKVNGLKDDAIVGKWTARALEKTNEERFFQAALALDKWRAKDPYPERYIRVNIPEFTLFYVDSNKVKRTHRVIVGANETPTPEFNATMRRLVTNPFWHVPYSIASTEILWGAKKDSAYFAKKNYKLFKNGEIISPDSVDWTTVTEKSFIYRVRQEGGGSNSLGRIKFLFPNSHYVFIHDTPGKYLFANDMRAYSHGCIRLHQPFDLAKEILYTENKEFIPDSLDAIVNRGVQRVYELKKPFEVYIEYITVTADVSGNIIFHPDIYGRDEVYFEKVYRRFKESTPVEMNDDGKKVDSFASVEE